MAEVEMDKIRKDFSELKRLKGEIREIERELRMQEIELIAELADKKYYELLSINTARLEQMLRT